MRSDSKSDRTEKFLRVRNGSPKVVLHIEREFVSVFAGFFLLISYIKKKCQIHIGIVFGVVLQIKLFVKYTYTLTLFRCNVVVENCFHGAKIRTYYYKSKIGSKIWHCQKKEVSLHLR